MKKSITKNEYYALLGIKTIADSYVRNIVACEKVFGETIGEESDGGSYDWSFEFLWKENASLEAFLEQRGIEVEDD